MSSPRSGLKDGQADDILVETDLSTRVLVSERGLRLGRTGSAPWVVLMMNSSLLFFHDTIYCVLWWLGAEGAAEEWLNFGTMLQILLTRRSLLSMRRRLWRMHAR